MYTGNNNRMKLWDINDKLSDKYKRLLELLVANGFRGRAAKVKKLMNTAIKQQHKASVGLNADYDRDISVELNKARDDLVAAIKEVNMLRAG